MRYIVLFDDVFGRPTYGLTDDPVTMLARRVAEDKLTPKLAKDARVFELKACDLDTQLLTLRIAHTHFLYLVRDNRLIVLDRLARKKLDAVGLEALRAELREHFPLQSFDPPWPLDPENEA